MNKWTYYLIIYIDTSLQYLQRIRYLLNVCAHSIVGTVKAVPRLVAKMVHIEDAVLGKQYLNKFSRENCRTLYNTGENFQILNANFKKLLQNLVEMDKMYVQMVNCRNFLKTYALTNIYVQMDKINVVMNKIRTKWTKLMS